MNKSFIFFGVGSLLLLASLPQAFFKPSAFLQSYLFSYLFWLEISLGSMALLLVHNLTGGRWGLVTRRILKSSTNTIYLMAILFVPVLCGFQKIYPWADPTKLQLGAYAHKALYFDFSFFISRALLYLLSWVLIAKKLSAPNNSPRFSAFALVYLGLSLTWAAIDWQMSLDTLWFSTIYGLIFIIGQALGAWAFVLLVYWLLQPTYPSSTISEKLQWDLGNLLLTIVILWAYVSFMQYLIVWSGNLPEEVTWFKKRMGHGWEWLMSLIFCFLFAAPFMALLFRKLKTNSFAMILLLAAILIFRVIERYWMIMPSFFISPSLSYTDITLLIGIGGLWLSLFLWVLNKRSMNKPEEVASHA